MNQSARLLLTAPASSSGKTTLTLALLHALVSRNLKPAACKCGPDYIDPMFHREVLGLGGYNLDPFLAEPRIVRALLARASQDSDLTLIEGAMGYYDGIGATAQASAWETAKITETPAVLVLTPGGSSLSAAALVRGFQNFRQPNMLKGIILNRCSRSSLDRLRSILEQETGLPVYGCLPNLPESEIPSRHLGLATPENILNLREKIARLGQNLADNLDLEALLALSRTAPPLTDTLPEVAPAAVKRPILAVARDAAFCFYYRENLELLQAAGADLAFFSPLKDSALPEETRGLYLGGGYPELYAGRLAANAEMRAALEAAIARGLPVWAECGGFLYLLEELEDASGRPHPMVGALPGRGFPTGSLRRFGYVSIRADADNLLLPQGGELRGHEFHHWDASDPGADCRVTKASSGAEWRALRAGRRVFAGFPHGYLWSNPAAARRLVEECAK